MLASIVMNLLVKDIGYTARSLATQAIFVMACPVLIALAHPVPQAREAFEVASIKPKGLFRGPAMIGIEFLPGGFVRGTNAPIPMIISDAYDISGKQLDLKQVFDKLVDKSFLSE